MASADFSASSFRRYRRPWPFRADGEISRNKTHFFRPAGCGFTTLLRLGLGLRHVMLTCPQVGLVSAFCAYPPNFASDFLHPRPRGRKLVLGYLVPPNWPIGDFHSRPCVMSCVHTQEAHRDGAPPWVGDLLPLSGLLDVDLVVADRSVAVARALHPGDRLR